MSFLMNLRNACGKIHFGMMLQIYKISGYDLYRKPNIFFNPAPSSASPIPTMGEGAVIIHIFCDAAFFRCLLLLHPVKKHFTK